MGANQTPEEIKQGYTDSMGSELGSLYSLLRKECTILYLEWAEFKELYGTSEERIRLLNQAASAFFFKLQGSMWERTLLHIARLTDPARSGGKGKENASLEGLVSVLAPEIRPKFEALLKTARKKCEFSRDWRNRRIAHRDLAVALKENSSVLAPASRLSVDAATAAIAEVLNLVESYYFGGAFVAYDESRSLGSAKALLHVLRDGLEAREARLRRLRSGKPLPVDMVPKRSV
jgi:hypothetical protein